MEFTINHPNARIQLGFFDDDCLRRPKGWVYSLKPDGTIFRRREDTPGLPDLYLADLAGFSCPVTIPSLAGKVDEIAFDREGCAWVSQHRPDGSTVMGSFAGLAIGLTDEDHAALKDIVDRIEHALVVYYAMARDSRARRRMPLPPGMAWPTPRLRQRLQSVYLTGVGAQYDRRENYAKLLARGQSFSLPTKRIAGRTGKCHINSVRYWALHPGKCQVATGYTTDPVGGGNWHQHSWVIKDGNLLETTPLTGIYYGFVLTEAETIVLYYNEVARGGPFPEEPLPLKKYLEVHGSRLARELRAG